MFPVLNTSYNRVVYAGDHHLQLRPLRWHALQGLHVPAVGGGCCLAPCRRLARGRPSVDGRQVLGDRRQLQGRFVCSVPRALPIAI